ncbi:MAG: thiol-disulfide oxidoreductase DCC family protein [Bacteroidota bacterium]
MSTQPSSNGPVMIFDGVCNICNSSVDFIMRNEEAPNIKFTSFQGEAGRKILNQFGKDPNQVDTIYFLEEGVLYDKSTAVLHIAQYLKGPWHWVYYFRGIPKGIRDWVYDKFAQNRYQLFGKKDSCRIPTPDEQARFV